jgi:hypothetical protein
VDQWKESVIVPIHKKGEKLTIIIIVGYHCYQLNTKFYIIGEYHRGFQCSRLTTEHAFCMCQILEKKWEYNKTVYQFVMDFKKASDSVRREVLYNILIEFGVPMKLVRLIIMCSN